MHLIDDTRAGAFGGDLRRFQGEWNTGRHRSWFLDFVWFYCAVKKLIFSVVAFLVKWQITVVGSVTDMSQKSSQQSEAPRFIKLMTESTSTATQTAAAPSSQEGWNLTFHLIKSCRNSDHQARLERAVRWVQHGRSGMWRFCRRHCHIEIRELVFARLQSQERTIWSFF